MQQVPSHHQDPTTTPQQVEVPVQEQQLVTQPVYTNLLLVAHLLGIKTTFEINSKLPNITHSDEFFNDDVFEEVCLPAISDEKEKKKLQKARAAIIVQGWNKLPLATNDWWYYIFFTNTESEKKLKKMKQEEKSEKNKNKISSDPDENEKKEKEEDKEKNEKQKDDTTNSSSKKEEQEKHQYPDPPFEIIDTTLGRAFACRKKFKKYMRAHDVPNRLVEESEVDAWRNDHHEFYCDVKEQQTLHLAMIARAEKRRAKDNFVDQKPSEDFWNSFYKHDTMELEELFSSSETHSADVTAALNCLDAFSRIMFYHASIDESLGESTIQYRPVFLRRWHRALKKVTVAAENNNDNNSNNNVSVETKDKIASIILYWFGTLRLVFSSSGLSDDDTDYYNSDDDYDEEEQKRRKARTSDQIVEEAEKKRKEGAAKITADEIEDWFSSQAEILTDEEAPSIDIVETEERYWRDGDGKVLDYLVYDALSHLLCLSVVPSSSSSSSSTETTSSPFFPPLDNVDEQFELRRDIATLVHLCNLQQPTHIAQLRRTNDEPEKSNLEAAMKRFKNVKPQEITVNIQLLGGLSNMLYSILDRQDDSIERFCPIEDDKERRTVSGPTLLSQFGLSISYYSLLALYHQILYEKHEKQNTSNNNNNNNDNNDNNPFHPVLHYIWNLSEGTGAKPTDTFSKEISNQIPNNNHRHRFAATASWYMIMMQMFNSGSKGLVCKRLCTPLFHEVLSLGMMPLVVCPPVAQWIAECAANFFDHTTNQDVSLASNFKTEAMRELILRAIGPNANTAKTSESFFTVTGLVTSRYRDFFVTDYPPSTSSSMTKGSFSYQMSLRKEKFFEEKKQNKLEIPSSNLPRTEPVILLADVVSAVGAGVKSANGISWFCSAVSRLVSPDDCNLRQATQISLDERILEIVCVSCTKYITTAVGLRNWCSLLYWIRRQIKRSGRTGADIEAVFNEKICGKAVCAALIEKHELCRDLGSAGMWWATAFYELGLHGRPGRQLRIEFSTPQFRKATKYVSAVCGNDEEASGWCAAAMDLIANVEAIPGPPDPFFATRQLEDETERDDFLEQRRKAITIKM